MKISLANEILSEERFIHSIKTALACLIGFILARFIHFPTEQWIIITTLVVMCAQTNVGGLMQKSYMRLLGTLAGSLIATSTLMVFHPNPAIHIIVIMLSAILFSFIATSEKSYSDAGTLGVVTVVVILINQNPTVISGFARCTEISLGILIAAGVSQLIFPIHARNHLRANQAITLYHLRNFYVAIFNEGGPQKKAGDLFDLDEKIAKSLIAQRKLAGEAKREIFRKSFNIEDFKRSLWSEKELLRSIIFMFHAYEASEESKKAINSIPSLLDFHQSISRALENIAENIEQKTSETILLPDIELLNVAVQEKILAASVNSKIQLSTFLFCANNLVTHLKNIAALPHTVNPA
ncbi:MAG: hypothetical protein ACD_60C00025G0002 [uncultured bacterium]|nr:MAG: hypothetical protein ACD_60C00025G0002 [uncultured bacterium]